MREGNSFDHDGGVIAMQWVDALTDRPGHRSLREAPPMHRRRSDRGRLARLAGLYAVIAGSLTLIGWAGGVPRLTDWANSGIAEKANTALAALLAGLSLLALTRRPGSRTMARGLAACAALIGGLTLLEHLAGSSLGIDTLLFDEPPGASDRGAGADGPISSTSFLMIGSACFSAPAAGAAALAGSASRRSSRGFPCWATSTSGPTSSTTSPGSPASLSSPQRSSSRSRSG